MRERIVYLSLTEPTMTLSLPPHFVLASFTVLTSLGSAAQDFAPFNASSQKLFATLDHAYTYSMVFDSTTVDSNLTTYHNIKTLRDTLAASNCPWWGAPECYRQDQPTWGGGRIESTNDSTHAFFNRWNQPVNLALSTVSGSQTLMYADADEQFLLSYEGESTMSVLGLSESVRKWTILHQDLDGTPINSPLNGSSVSVGETIGLFTFFRVDSFPLVLVPTKLVGQSEPPIGLYTITPAVLHDHQPGDEVQYSDSHWELYQPGANYHRYYKYIYLERVDLPDSIRYLVRYEGFDAGQTELYVDTFIQKFPRTGPIASIPFDRFNGTQPILRAYDFCGLSLWYFETSFPAIGYCEEEHCWGGTDTNGPPTTGWSSLVVGLGPFSEYASNNYMSPFNDQTWLTYFKKNGIECMNEVMVGTPEAVIPPTVFTLSPNPSDGIFKISSEKPVLGVEVVDPQGQVVANIALDAQRTKLDLRSAANGLYVVRLHFADGAVGTGRVVIGR